MHWTRRLIDRSNYVFFSPMDVKYNRHQGGQDYDPTLMNLVTKGREKNELPQTFDNNPNSLFVSPRSVNSFHRPKNWYPDL